MTIHETSAALECPEPPRRSGEGRRRLDRRRGRRGALCSQEPCNRGGAGDAARTWRPRNRSGHRGSEAGAAGMGTAHRHAPIGDPEALASACGRPCRRSCPDPDCRTGQAACRGTWRDPLRGRLHRMVRRGGEAPLRRHHSRPRGRCSAPGDEAAGRGRCGDHALEFPERHDRPEGGARPRCRLRCRREASRRNPAVDTRPRCPCRPCGHPRRALLGHHGGQRGGVRPGGGRQAPTSRRSPSPDPPRLAAS